MNNLLRLQQRAQEKLVVEHRLNPSLLEGEFGHFLGGVNPLLLKIKHYDPEKTIIEIEGVGEFEYESFLFSPELDHDKYIEASLERLKLKLKCQLKAYEEEVKRIERLLKNI